MRVRQFRLERYRSILKSEGMDLRTMTVLVGPNNEGKSNILRGLVVGLRAISDIGKGAPYPARGRGRRDDWDFETYTWESDIPDSVRSAKPNSATVLEFDFELNDDEIEEFKERTKSANNGTLKVRLRLYRGRREMQIIKQGPGSKKINEKKVAIAKFISDQVRVQYIPASRPAFESVSLMRAEVGSRLAALESDQEYRKALEVVLERRKDALSPLGTSVTDALRRFLPNVESVEIEPSGRDYFGVNPWAWTEFDFMVDDGVKTPLASKGDGVQSLAAISLAHSLAQANNKSDLILAVEEPEAHLHPSAVHELRAVLDEIAHDQQVVITTHSPLLVSRGDVAGNVIIRQNRAVQAGSLGQIRDILGVRIEDNLQSASVALLVEGLSDKRIIQTLLAGESPIIQSALTDGALRIEITTGASNVAYQFRHFYDSVCRVHVLLDSDAAGRKALEALEKEHGFSHLDATMVRVVDMNDSEVEDLLDEAFLGPDILARFNVTLDPAHTHPQKKFKLRMQDYFAGSGQGWTKAIEDDLKTLVADAVERDPVAALRADRRGPLDALVREIESKLEAS